MRTLSIHLIRVWTGVERQRLLTPKLPDLSNRILHHARDHGGVTIADAVVLTGASRNTLKLHFKALRERGLLALPGVGRGGLVQPALSDQSRA